MTTKKDLADNVAAGPGEPRSKADRAYTFIRQTVLDGRSGPGERLVIEHFAREMGVSVVPVREAIRRLEAEGYITYTRNVGATVTSTNLDRYSETIEALSVLEGVAIGLAAPHVTTRDIKEARALNEKMTGSLDAVDPVGFATLNRRFHNDLYQRCPNRHIVDMVNKEWSLIDATRRSTFAFVSERARGSIAEHESLLQMIEAGQPPHEIEAFARGHHMRTARTLYQHIDGELSAQRLSRNS
jgi:DNA-binding GntR family transcriptional regulator